MTYADPYNDLSQKNPALADIGSLNYHRILTILAEEIIEEAINTGSKLLLPGFVIYVKNTRGIRFYFKNEGMPGLLKIKIEAIKGAKWAIAVCNGKIAKERKQWVFSRLCEASADLDLVNTYEKK